MADDNEALKVTQVDGQQENNDSSDIEELADEQQSADQDETQTDDCIPLAKRIRLEPDTEESASGVSSRKSSLSRDDEANRVSSIVLAKLLPKNVPAASLSNPDELDTKLVNVLQSKLRKIQSLPEELNLLDFTLPPLYCKQIQRSLPLLMKIIATCTQHLVSKGVKSVTEVILPSINIDKIEKLFSDKWHQSLKLEFLKCPVEAAEINEIYLHIVPMLTALQSYQVEDVQLCGPVLEADPKAIKKGSAEWKKLSKNVKEKFTGEYASKFLLGSDRPWSKSSAKRRKSKEGVKKEKKPTKGGEKATPGKGKESSYLEFTTDATSVPLQHASHHMSAYEYWDLEEIHKQYTGKDTVLAIVDSGVMDVHDAFLDTPDKFSELNYGGPSGNTLDHDGHGTLCAGIAGGNRFKAYKNPEDPTSQLLTVMPGVAPDAKLVICKVTEGNQYRASVDVVIDALKAIKAHNELPEPCNKIDVVSISMGCYAFSGTLAQAISDLVSQGVIIVCAASNDGHKFHTPICFPARLGNVICVGSHGASGKASLFSPVGQALDFLAPGENILGPGNLDYTCQAACKNGTSFAAPAVAGLVCLILECLRKCLQKKSPEQDASQFHNHWVMKELLREMSTNGGTHTIDRGFGTLTPIRFFRQPECFITTINMDILCPSKSFYSRR